MKSTMRSIFLWMRGKVICCLHGRSSFVGMAVNPLPTLLFASSIFEDRLIRKGKRWTLKWKLNPMPTMLTDEMKAMPQSVQPTPAAPPRKPPAKRTYQEDEINAFLSQHIIGDFSELNSTLIPTKISICSSTHLISSRMCEIIF